MRKAIVSDIYINQTAVKGYNVTLYSCLVNKYIDIIGSIENLGHYRRLFQITQIVHDADVQVQQLSM